MAMFVADAIMLVAKLQRVEIVCDVKYTRNHQTGKRGSVSDRNLTERGAWSKWNVATASEAFVNYRNNYEWMRICNTQTRLGFSPFRPSLFKRIFFDLQNRRLFDVTTWRYQFQECEGRNRPWQITWLCQNARYRNGRNWHRHLDRPAEEANTLTNTSITNSVGSLSSSKRN